jgi:hypothetical protein
LVSAVCLPVWSELEQRMQAAAAAHDEPFQALRARSRAYVQFGLQHPVQYRLLLLHPAATAATELRAAETYLREE